MKNTIIFLSISLFLALPSLSVKADIYVQCNSCTDYANIAIKNVGNSPGLYKVHVGDFEKEILSSFSVRVIYLGSEPGTSFPPYVKRVSPIPSTQIMENEFREFVAVRNQLIDEFDNLSDTDVNVDTVWDLYADTQAQDAYLQSIRDNSTITQMIMSLSNVLTAWTKITINFTINLASGAKIVVTYSHLEMLENGDVIDIYEIDFEKSRDQYGNKLVMPNGSGGNGGGALFPNDTSSLADFLAAAYRSGIPVTNGGGVGARTLCTLTGTVLTCIIIPG